MSLEGCGRRIGDFKCCSVIQGDCLELMKALPDDCVDAVITDPPYNCGVPYGCGVDDRRTDYWPWLHSVIEECRRLATVVSMTHRVSAVPHITSQDWLGVWYKPGAFGSRIGNSCLLPNWEPIFLWGIHSQGVQSDYSPDVFVFSAQSAQGRQGIGREKWRNGTYDGDHPCPKPLDLWERLLQTIGQKSETILDPFLGSGTTAVAAKKLGRHFLGFEISPEYCRIAEERIALVEMQPTLFEKRAEQLVMGE